MDLLKVLEATVSSDKNELEAAQKYLEQAAEGDSLPQFMVALATILADINNSQVARTAAGLQLKNCLTSKDEAKKLQYQQRWIAIDVGIRNQVKALILSALGTETGLSSAAQCIAGIAGAEFPQNQWPDLMDTLVMNVTGTQANDHLKEASLEAIGYMCQDIDASFLGNYSNNILQAIATGMKSEEPNNNVKYHATTALLNSLEFTRANFEKEDERNYIMNIVCQCTQSTDKRIITSIELLKCYQNLGTLLRAQAVKQFAHRFLSISCSGRQVQVASLQCLVQIVSLYYEYMEAYMGTALFAITLNAMKSEEDEIALQGIEFWSSVCDEEIDLAIEAAEAAESGTQPEHFSRFYAKGALEYLTPILLLTLTKQEEFDDEDDWNPNKAAGVCLMLLASCAGNEIVAHVLPFITQNIKHDEWKFRDAAVMAFGCIQEGPEPEALKPVVLQEQCKRCLEEALSKGMPVLLELMKDPSVIVKDSVAWTLSRVCEHVPDAALDPSNLDNLLNALLENLSSEPRVATNVCWAFSSLADAAFENAPADEGEDPQTYVLSGKFQFIVEKIIQTAERIALEKYMASKSVERRPDANQSNLRSSAYEAVMELVKNSPKDCYETCRNTIVAVLDRMNKILQMENAGANVGDHSQHNDFKSLLCAVLQSSLRKLNLADAEQVGDEVMRALLQMLHVTKVGGVQEDAFMAVGTLVEALSDKFIKYMEALKPFLLAGLANRAEYQVCISAVGVVGDLCRALGGALLPYCDDFMNRFMENLADQTVHRSVKPHILSAFEDIALAVGTNFSKYAEVVLTTLQQASLARVDKNDYDMVDYLNELRESCLEAYTGVVQGLKGEDEKNISPEVKVVEPHVPHIVQFMEMIALDPDRTDTLVGSCCGLLGDLCSVFGAQMLRFAEKQVFQDLLQEGRRSKTAKTKTLAVWASRTIRNLKK